MSSVSHPLPQSQESNIRYLHEERPVYDDGPPARKFAPMIPPDLLCPEIDGRAVQVYCLLACHANIKTGLCEVPTETMMERLDVSRSTVQRSIDALEKFGFVEVINRRRQNLCNQYRLPLQMRDNHKSYMNHGPLNHVSPVNDHEPPVTHAHDSPVTHLTEDVITELKQTTTTRAPAREESPPPMNGRHWIDEINEVEPDSFTNLLSVFQAITPEFSEHTVRSVITSAERKVGQASRAEIQTAITETISALRRAVKAEKEGRKPIGSLHGFTVHLIGQKFQELRGMK